MRADLTLEPRLLLKIAPPRVSTGEEAPSLAQALGLRSLLDQPFVRTLQRALLGDGESVAADGGLRAAGTSGAA